MEELIENARQEERLKQEETAKRHIETMAKAAEQLEKEQIQAGIDAIDKAIADRWDLLSPAEKSRVEDIRESLTAGKGISLSADDFLFATENSVLLSAELVDAAEISCGPLIDTIARDFKLSTSGAINLRKLFDRHSLIGRRIPTENNAAQFMAINRIDSYFRNDSRGMRPTSEHMSVYERLAILGEVIHKKWRHLADEEIMFLREFPWTHETLTEYLKTGPDLDEMTSRDEAAKAAAPIDASKVELSPAEQQTVKDVEQIASDIEKWREKLRRIKSQANLDNPKAAAMVVELESSIHDAEEKIATTIDKSLMESQTGKTRLQFVDHLFKGRSKKHKAIREIIASRP